MKSTAELREQPKASLTATTAPTVPESVVTTKNVNLLLLIGLLLLAGATIWGVAHGIKQDFLIPTSAIETSGGARYTTVLPATSRYWLFENLTDNLNHPTQSKTELFENDKPLGPSHSLHDNILKVGSGQFSHWGSALYFSTSDNSDPRTNGCRYRVVYTATLPMWVLAVLVPCLLIPLYLNRELVLRLAKAAVKSSLVEAIPPIVQGAQDAVAPSTSAESIFSTATSRKTHWRWGVFAALTMSLLSLYPQIDLWITRGADWQGSYTSLCYDEENYGAYVNGLMLGRPRRAQPFEIIDPAKPFYESYFSIQMVPAYSIAFLARAFGLTLSQAFIVLTPLIAFLSALMLFYLFTLITRREAFAAVGALAVLVFGTLAARHSVAIGWMGRSWYGNFLFLRRYEPSFIFPVFFGFIALIWHAFTGQGRRAWCAAIAAGLAFSLLIFSYFFLWTAAIAWLACFVLAWLVARFAEWPMIAKRLAPLSLCGAATLAVYALILTHRDPVHDVVLFYNLTHAPDFRRAPLLIAVVGILLLLWGIKKRSVQWREPVVLLACSFALMPVAIFNQQIVTGRLLQPVHYEMFSANYLSLMALIFILAILWHRQGLHFKRWASSGLIALFACVVLGWGIVEMHGAASMFKARNIDRDLFMPVAKRLTQLAAEHGKDPNDREVVFSPDIIVVSDNISALAPQVPLWGTSLQFASRLSIEEQYERYFQHLYYSGAREEFLRSALKNNDLIAVSSAFTYGRYNPSLDINFKPITSDEIRDKVRKYAEYIAGFNYERARHPQISYVVVYTNAPFDFSNLDRWYSRDAGEQIGPFTLYQVKLSDFSNLGQAKSNPEFGRHPN